MTATTSTTPAATVNLKLTPQQFDLLRDALADYRSAQLIQNANATQDPAYRRRAGDQAAQAASLIRALGGDPT